MIPVLLPLVIIGILFFVIMAGRPDEFRVTRSIAIAAPSVTIFDQVNDFHKWAAWSPWAGLDPACQNTFSGAAVGQDAGFAWDGNDKVGAGRATIAESQPGSRVRINLELQRPFEVACATEFTFQSEGRGTLVTWNMWVKNNLMLKVFGLFTNCDAMVGKHFEKGLATLKSISETGAKQ